MGGQRRAAHAQTIISGCVRTNRSKYFTELITSVVSPYVPPVVVRAVASPHTPLPSVHAFLHARHTARALRLRGGGGGVGPVPGCVDATHARGKVIES